MIVMKFGGTSVEDAKAIDRVASIVQGRQAQQPVVVVSAMAKVTDTLLTMAKAAGAGERKTALKLCRSLQERHYNTASELLGTARFTEFHSELGSDFETLDELLRGISAVGEITPRTTDHVAAFGEMLSSKIVAAAFDARGLSGAHVDSRDVLVTDSSYMQAVPQYEETNTRLQQKVQPLLRDGQVPVMGGFIGANRAGITTTIGRGGSDFSAAIFGAGLGAERIEIWTDVRRHSHYGSADLPGSAPHQGHQLRRGRRARVFRCEGAASRDRAARDPEKYSGLRFEFAQSCVRRDTHHHPRSAQQEYFQGDCGQEEDHDCRRGRTAHAAGPRISQVDLRGLRSP